jgi:(1->4)-alpha-D-glucan 1-alpha-D-glucosylmutase
MAPAPAIKKDPLTVLSALGRSIPVSTYRLQLHKDFRFVDAQRMVSYLERLGLTACYASPILKAKPGSMHGYDICDHSQLNPELGTDAEFTAWAQDLRARKMGLILDFVPNHMSIDAEENPWWRDVLENGPGSLYADFFDIDWAPLKSELKDKILLPVLGDQYGRVLEEGQLKLQFHNGRLSLHYGDQHLPMSPDQSVRVYKRNLAALTAELKEGQSDLREFLSVLTALEHLPPLTETDPARRAERHREKEVNRDRLARLVAVSPAIARYIEESVRFYNGSPNDRTSFDPLHELLEAQAYRLSYWKTASHEINYRRFFDVNQLAGIRMENPAVFKETHRLVLKLLTDGLATGLRMDHPDGLFDPASYFEAVQEAYLFEWLRRQETPDAPELSDELKDALRTWRTSERKKDPHGIAAKPLYLVAEKILSADEDLLPHWALHGTSGYDFLNDVNGIFVDTDQEDTLKRVYVSFTGQPVAFKEMQYTCKKLIMSTSMASELKVLAHALNRISEGDRRSRDFTLDSLEDALKEVIACFRVYRTYINTYRAGASDRALIDEAVDEAKRRNPALEATIFDFVREVLLHQVAFTMKFQQYTGPVQAKSVEDTAFYRYNLLSSLNEVGGDPDKFGLPASDFHAHNVKRREAWPYSMLTSSTHDTKRGEDARARLNVISEIPEEWEKMLSTWSAKTNRFRTLAGRTQAPDRLDEYFLYQTLLAVWPMDETPTVMNEICERVCAYMTKAMKEAKRHTSWIRPNEAYEAAVDKFIRSLLIGPDAKEFVDLFRPFARRIAAAGMLNSLGQVLVKIASPGVPDFYQGTELWDLSLVDPDNRRPVDYALRETFFAEMDPWLAKDNRLSYVQELLTEWTDGRIKMLLTICGLKLRRDMPTLFLEGAYTPITIKGSLARHAVAWAREDKTHVLLTIVPRFMTRLTGDLAWKDTAIVLPPAMAGLTYKNAITGEVLDINKASAGECVVPLSALLTVSPGGLWIAAKR